MAGGAGVKHVNFGLLMVRLGVGGFFCWRGLAELLAGDSSLSGLSRDLLGISTSAQTVGVVVALAMCLCGLAILVGYLVRPAALILLVIAAFAARHLIGPQWAGRAGLAEWSKWAERAFVFFGLFLMGGGDMTILSLFHGGGRKGGGQQSAKEK